MTIQEYVKQGKLKGIRITLAGAREIQVSDERNLSAEDKKKLNKVFGNIAVDEKPITKEIDETKKPKEK